MKWFGIQRDDLLGQDQPGGAAAAQPGLVALGMRVLDLDGDVRQVGEFGQSLPVMRGVVGAFGGNRDNGAEMSGPQPP